MNIVQALRSRGKGQEECLEDDQKALAAVCTSKVFEDGSVVMHEEEIGESMRGASAISCELMVSMDFRLHIRDLFTTKSSDMALSCEKK